MSKADYTSYVNTNIGTVGHLLTATSPSVQSPHGAAIIAPVFTPGMKDIYNADKIYGFQAGSAVIMPVEHAQSPDFMAQGSHFDHDFETARPHYYEVLLEDSNIQESHTAFENTGIFKFKFEDSEKAYAMVYFRHCQSFRIDGNRIYGTASMTRGDIFITTLLEFENAVSIEAFDTQLPNGYTPENLEPAKAFRVKFSDKKGKVRFVLSPMGEKSCEKCFEKKISDKSFHDIKEACAESWNSLLGKIRVKGGDENRKTILYTAIYRVVSRMHNYSVNGEYLGFDKQVHPNDGHDYYCDDGIWDTYRGAHPMQMLLEPKIHSDILASYLRMYEQSGWLPRFPYLNGNIPCMLGFHTIALFADALAKDFPFDLELAYEAGYKNATKRTMCPWMDGEAEELTHCYYEKGFFPALEEDEEETNPNVHEFEGRQAVAVTMEQSYDDWCMAQLARALGKKEDEEYFLKRSKNYLNVYDEKIGFVHPKKQNGEFTKVYNPKFCGGQGGRKYFAENNAYIYNFHIQHDMQGLVNMHGGSKKFAEKLDNLYVEQYGVLKSTFLMQYPDATGLMGQFCMGNEPSFHIPYLYNFCGQAYKTQRKIHEIIDLWFTNHPLGICGDEDGGAMSAFLAFSALGFYTVSPGTDRYDLGSPIFDYIEIDLPNGNVFTIEAEGASGKAKYIKEATLDGKELTRPYFTHREMMKGAKLVLTMSDRPNKDLWAEK